MLQFNIQENLLRIILLSQIMIRQSIDLPRIKQLQVVLKADNSYNAVLNLILSGALIGRLPNFLLVNRKQSLVVPRVTVTGLLLKLGVAVTVLQWMERIADKLISISFNTDHNQFTFVFKASDILPIEIRQLGKVIGSEIGVFSLEMSVQTTAVNSVANEFLLRGYQLPVKITN
jgi:hypothetical protein